MKKISGIAGAFLAVTLLLAGCGRAKLSVSDQHLKADGLAVTIKGETNQDHVTYQINHGSKKNARVKQSAFTVMVPVQTKKQTVQLTAGSQKETVTVGKVKALGKYTAIKRSYDQGLVMTHLSSKDQQTLDALGKKGQQLKKQSQLVQQKVAAAKKKLAQGDSAAALELQEQATAGQKLQQQAAELQKQQSALQPKLAQAKKATKDDRLPNSAQAGIHNLVDQKNFLLRANVKGDQVNALVLAVPVKAIKDKAQAKTFFTKFALISSSVGADPQAVMKQFKKQSDSKQSTKTTAKTIHSNGVAFSIGISSDRLYIYLNK